MHRAVAAFAIAVAAAAVPVDAQETEITVGGGLGLELFDKDVLTYPTADLGLTRWWANGWGSAVAGRVEPTATILIIEDFPTPHAPDTLIDMGRPSAWTMILATVSATPVKFRKSRSVSLSGHIDSWASHLLCPWRAYRSRRCPARQYS